MSGPGKNSIFVGSLLYWIKYRKIFNCIFRGRVLLDFYGCYYAILINYEINLLFIAVAVKI